MRWQDSLHLALRAITAHRLRSFLTLLGIGVGIAAVILLTSIGEGLHRFVLAEFGQFGTNVINLHPGRQARAAARPACPRPRATSPWTTPPRSPACPMCGTSRAR